MSVFSAKQKSKESKTDATVILLGRLTGAYNGEMRDVSDLVSSAGITPETGDFVFTQNAYDLISVVSLESDGNWKGHIPGEDKKISKVYPWVQLVVREDSVYYLRFK